MQKHLNTCKAAKRKAEEATKAYQELGREGLRATVRKRRRLDLTEVRSGFFFFRSVH